jgi:hypothetical protein
MFFLRESFVDPFFFSYESFDPALDPASIFASSWDSRERRLCDFIALLYLLISSFYLLSYGSSWSWKFIAP